MNQKVERNMSIFEKYLTLWVLFCIGAGILLGKLAPSFAGYLDSLAVYVNEAPVVSTKKSKGKYDKINPIAISFFCCVDIRAKSLSRNK